MFKTKQKGTNQVSAQTDRYLNKTKRAVPSNQNAHKTHLSFVNHPENKQKSVDLKKKKKVPHHPTKHKKIRLLTQEPEKSHEEFVQIPLFSIGRDVNLHSPSPRSEMQEDDYELTRTFRKGRRGQNSRQKDRKQSEQIETMPYEMVNVNKIKLRGSKNKSSSCKGNQLLNNKKGKKSKKSLNKPLPKTERNSQATPQPKRRFLSPEIAKLESSYCFQTDQDYNPHGERVGSPNVTSPAKGSGNILTVPKRGSKLLFDSTSSMWRSVSPKNLLRSTVDLLN